MSYYNTTTDSAEPSDLATTETPIVSSDASVGPLKEQIAQLEKKLADSEAEWSAKLADKEQNYSAVEELLAVAKHEKQEALDQIASVRKEANQIVEETEDKARAAQDALDEKTKELAAAQEQLAQSQNSSADASGLQDKINALENDLKQANEASSAKDAEVERLTKELSAARESASAAASAGGSAEEKDAEIEKLRERIGHLEESKKQADARVEALNDDVHAWEVKYDISEEAAKAKNQEIMDSLRTIGDLKCQLELAESSGRAALIKREAELKEEADAVAAKHAEEKAQLEARLAAAEEQVNLKVARIESESNKEQVKDESADIKLNEKVQEVERLTRLLQSAQAEAEKLRADVAAVQKDKQVAVEQAKSTAALQEKRFSDLQQAVDNQTKLVAQRNSTIEQLQADLNKARAAASAAPSSTTTTPTTSTITTSRTTATPAPALPSNAITPVGVGLGFLAGAGVGLLAFYANKK